MLDLHARVDEALVAAKAVQAELAELAKAAEETGGDIVDDIYDALRAADIVVESLELALVH